MKNDNCLVVITDSECMLCNNVVRFLMSRDPRKRLLFSFFKGDFVKRKLGTGAVAFENTSVILLLPSEKVLIKSRAALKILAQLGLHWRLLSYALRLIPNTIRDYIYDIMAKNRRKWFGKSDYCTLDTEFSNRFLN